MMCGYFLPFAGALPLSPLPLPLPPKDLPSNPGRDLPFDDLDALPLSFRRS